MEPHRCADFWEQWERHGDSDYGFVTYFEDVTLDGDDDSVVVSVMLSYMNPDGKAVPTNPQSWNLRTRDTCRPDDCEALGWPNNFIHLNDLN